ncbi:hypothetical protein [Roseimicrobium sp. ORNL1]|uniref:hypothetical protein n=1 Tax=Roseimicrobium sp. ORNL1 TaxID=2711231 RepID=UPI0013E1C287|nr:hypothetical protein [Roseimicrobium sp. ORNL1]QIF00610.1 hypothetical protein G5S37_03420 [Roseimicrobium sp. ORNL1]
MMIRRIDARDVHHHECLSITRRNIITKKKLSGLSTGELAIQQPIRGSERKGTTNGLRPIGLPNVSPHRQSNHKIFWEGVNCRGGLFQKQTLILSFERVQHTHFTKILGFFRLTGVPEERFGPEKSFIHGEISHFFTVQLGVGGVTGSPEMPRKEVTDEF